MRVLVIGGTRFVGRHVVQAALDGGHEVTLFHRGRTGTDLFPDATHLLGDRDEDLSALATGSWDATVDVCAYVPRQVRSLAGALDGRGGRYAFVSSISAYAATEVVGITEDAPLAVLADETTEEVTGETYGGLKALCERAAVESFGEESLIVRPTYVIGPHDPTGRFPYWVDRLARGGRVLAAGPREQAVQTVDGRDLATFAVGLLEQGASGPFHVAAPSPPYGLADLLQDVAGAVAPAGTEIVWVDPSFAVEQGLTGRDLPLWHGGEDDPVGAVDPSAAFARGMRARPVGDSARDVLAAGPELVDGVGLDQDREQELLRAWQQR